MFYLNLNQKNYHNQIIMLLTKQNIFIEASITAKNFFSALCRIDKETVFLRINNDWAKIISGKLPHPQISTSEKLGQTSSTDLTEKLTYQT